LKRRSIGDGGRRKAGLAHGSGHDGCKSRAGTRHQLGVAVNSAGRLVVSSAGGIRGERAFGRAPAAIGEKRVAEG
jgi:hypothetical protein